jgi:hypothetical protein
MARSAPQLTDRLLYPQDCHAKASSKDLSGRGANSFYRIGRNLQVVSRVVVVAIGINALGSREVLGTSHSQYKCDRTRNLTSQSSRFIVMY